MKNEYGANLDRNGYAPSIIDRECEGCHWCGCTGTKLDRHEVFHGPFRQKSKEYGLWINLCPGCHRTVHNGNGTVDSLLKEEGELAALFYYEWTPEEFIRRFGKNYL